MFKKVLFGSIIVGMFSGCGLTPTADSYIDAIKNQDIEVLQKYEEKALREEAISHKASKQSNIEYTKYRFIQRSD